MNFSVGNYTTSYQNTSERYGTGITSASSRTQSSTSARDLKTGIERRRMLASSNVTEEKTGDGYQKKTFKTNTKSVVESTVDYSKTLQAQRTKAKDTGLQKKRVKYQSKSLSSKIMRSKTSVSARQVVSQARREIAKLKKQRTDPNVDQEELEAAITHAQAMERVAKKKARHLEEEEIAKANGGFGIGSDLSEDSSEDKDIQNDNSENDETVEEATADGEEFIGEDVQELNSNLQEEYVEIAGENMEAYEVPNTADTMSSFDMSDLISQISDITAEMTEEMSQSMNEMLSEMGLDEMSDALMAYSGDMSSEDLKNMEIKHRNKELKEMVEADSEYLKAIFEHYQKMKNAGGIPGMPSHRNSAVPASSTSSPVVSTPNPVMGSGPALSIPEALSQVVPTGKADISPMPVLDVSV